ncbi:2710_t:CDS:2, partial [Rhizophagus irregularis]
LWPSEMYKEFMMAVTQYHLSDATADSILHILKKHCTDQLPGSTRKGRTIIDNMDVKGLLPKEDGIYLAINGKVEHFTIYLSIIIADMLEVQDICCTYKSYHIRCPCYKCLTPGDQLNNMNIEQDMIDLHNHENMQEAIASHNAENCSIHEYDNFFWNFRIMNIYDAAALDRMHLQEIGLFPYMLDYIIRDMLMHQYGNQIISYQQGTKFTGGEMRDVMKIIVFVLDELYTTGNKINNQTDSNLYTISLCKNLIIC